MSLLGVDIGTGGLKVMAIEADSGRSLAIAFREYSETRPRPGWVELSGDFGAGGIHRGGRRSQPPAVGPSRPGQRHELLDLLRRDRAARQEDARPRQRHRVGRHPGCRLLPRIRERIDELQLFRTTGVPLHSMFPLVRLVWYQQNQPEVLREAAKFLGWGDLIVWRLGLPAVTDFSNAARWMAFNIREGHWAGELFEALDLPMDILPEPRLSASPIGEVPAAMRDKLGFQRPVTVVTGAIDQICAAIGGGIRQPGDAVVGTGTWEVLTTLVKDPPTDATSLRRGFAYSNFVTAGEFIGMAANSSGGALLRWFRDEFGQLERATADLTGQDVYPLLLAEMPADPTGILVLPHFQGSHNPWMDPLSRSAVLGMTWQTTRGAFLRALLEGMTYELRANIEGLAEAGSEFSVLRNTGGGSRSAAWCQMKADILNLAIETVDLPEAGCLAAAILAGVGTGIYPSFVEPQTRFVHPAARYEPNPAMRSRYDALFATYKQVYPAVSPVTHQL